MNATTECWIIVFAMQVESSSTFNERNERVYSELEQRLNSGLCENLIVWLYSLVELEQSSKKLIFG